MSGEREPGGVSDKMGDKWVVFLAAARAVCCLSVGLGAATESGVRCLNMASQDGHESILIGLPLVTAYTILRSAVVALSRWDASQCVLYLDASKQAWPANSAGRGAGASAARR